MQFKSRSKTCVCHVLFQFLQLSCITGVASLYASYRTFVKLKLSLCLTNHYTMKAYWGMEVQLTHSLTTALDGGEWSASLPSRLTLRERTPSTNRSAGKLGPRASLNAVVKISTHYCTCRESNSASPARIPVTILTELLHLRTRFRAHFLTERTLVINGGLTHKSSDW
jgi:hypothetical protein